MLSAASRLFNVFVVHSRRWMCLSAASRLSICLIRLIALNVFVGGPPPFAIFVEYCCASIEKAFVRVVVVSAQSSASTRLLRTAMGKAHVRLFLGRCMAAKVSLLETPDPEAREAISAAVMPVLRSALEQAKEEKSIGEAFAADMEEVTNTTGQIGLPGPKLVELLDLLSAVADNWEAKKKSWVMQDYSAAFQYQDKAFWDMVQVASTGSMQLVESSWYTKCIKLGCRQPNEGSTRLWTSLFLAIQLGGFAQCANLGPDALKSEHNRVKGAFKMCASSAAKPIEDIKTLPAAHQLMKEEYPLTFEAAFSDFETNPPIICPFDLHLINLISNLWKCRGGGNRFQSALPPVQPTHRTPMLMPPSLAPSPMMQMPALTNLAPEHTGIVFIEQTPAGGYRVANTRPLPDRKNSEPEASAWRTPPPSPDSRGPARSSSGEEDPPAGHSALQDAPSSRSGKGSDSAWKGSPQMSLSAILERKSGDDKEFASDVWGAMERRKKAKTDAIALRGKAQACAEAGKSSDGEYSDDVGDAAAQGGPPMKKARSAVLLCCEGVRVCVCINICVHGYV